MAVRHYSRRLRSMPQVRHVWSPVSNGHQALTHSNQDQLTADPLHSWSSDHYSSSDQRHLWHLVGRPRGRHQTTTSSYSMSKCYRDCFAKPPVLLMVLRCRHARPEASERLLAEACCVSRTLLYCGKLCEAAKLARLAPDVASW